MTFSDTAGNQHYVPDECAFCNMTTGGHAPNCPLYSSSRGFVCPLYVHCPTCGHLLSVGTEHLLPLALNIRQERCGVLPLDAGGDVAAATLRTPSGKRTVEE